MDNIDEILDEIQVFKSGNLTKKVSDLEIAFEGLSARDVYTELADNSIGISLFKSALKIKSISGQIDVIVHAIGILLSLPYILLDSERIESLSIGAGNTGRKFDLETSYRVAEYKFIEWKGGAEAIRQNQLFKDFYYLCEYQTTKQKDLYVLGREIPLKFFYGRRSLSSVCSKNKSLWEAISSKYGNKYKVVKDYYLPRRELVNLVDLTQFDPFVID